MKTVIDKITKMKSEIEKELSDIDITIDEVLTRNKVIRNGKRIIKVKTDKDGYKVSLIDGKPKEIKMSAVEKRNRKKAAIKNAKKVTSGQKAKAAKKREKSNKKLT